MKEYKVITVDRPSLAEGEMNKYAKQGWEVKAVSYWPNTMTDFVVITLERDVNR